MKEIITMEELQSLINASIADRRSDLKLILELYGSYSEVERKRVSPTLDCIVRGRLEEIDEMHGMLTELETSLESAETIRNHINNLNYENLLNYDNDIEEISLELQGV